MTEERRLSRRGFLRGLGLRQDTAGRVPPAEELALLTIAEAARRIASGAVSPVELMRAVLARIERLEPRIGAFVTRVDPDQCVELARDAEHEIAMGRYRGKLHGIPIGLKDTHSPQGLRTTARSAISTISYPSST